MMNGSGMKFVNPDRSKVVVLERVDETPVPAYCVHGKTKCFGCDKWVWLGSETFELVSSGGAMPICLGCAKANGSLSQAKFLDRLKDHR